MAEQKADLYCEKCKRIKKDDQFYSTNNLDDYPNGKLRKCKTCMTMHVNNWEPETYKWILEECDVPYLPAEWHKLLAKYSDDPSKATGVSVIGKYLAKMRLQKYKNYRWKDSEYLQKVQESQIAATLQEQGATQAQIDKEIERYNTNPVPRPDMPEPDDYFGISSKEDPSALGLTDEDVMYLRLKWGSTYSPEEWVRLEQLYDEMTQSYDITTAGHIDTLKLLCKTSLKANQLIDMNNVEAFQKMSKVYNDLMKSGNFMAVQNKKDNGDYVSSISELVEICEKKGFIPRYYIEEPGDRVDETIIDLKKYTHDLIVDELNLGDLIESAVKEMVELESQDEEDEDEAIMNYDNVDQLKDEDFIEFSEFLEGEEESNINPE